MKANKFYILITGFLLCRSAVHAQEYATDRSIAEQIKKGTVPGSKISAQPAQKKTEPKESSQKISVPFKQQLLNGTYPGLTVTKSPAPTTASIKAKKEEVILPSSRKAEPVEKSEPVERPLMQAEQTTTAETGEKASTHN